MLRSLYSGISGLRAHQTMLDVTGNNIANVNTAGFKASSTQFQDTLSQMTQGASAPQAQSGGSNPAQIGLGVRVAGVSTNFSQGSSQSTGRATDMMISGDGFFVTSKGGQQLFTRAGCVQLGRGEPAGQPRRRNPPGLDRQERRCHRHGRSHRRHHAEPEHHGGHRHLRGDVGREPAQRRGRPDITSTASSRSTTLREPNADLTLTFDQDCDRLGRHGEATAPHPHRRFPWSSSQNGAAHPQRPR